MPIARVPSAAFGVDSIPILYRGVVVPPGIPIPAGSAVAIINGGGSIGCSVGGGSLGQGEEYVLCGALPGDHSNAFVGFMLHTTNPCEEGMVIATRGSRVTPIVELGAALIPEGDVFLSTTPGEVTQTPPGGGARVLRVGFAASDVEIILVTDYYL